MLQVALRTVALSAEGLKRLHEHASLSMRAPSPSWPAVTIMAPRGLLSPSSPDTSVAIMAGCPFSREPRVEPEIVFVPVLSEGTASRLGILVNGERESHVPDRLSKSLIFCAETTAHVIQRHDDGRTLPTGVLRTARAIHAGGENASPQVDARDAHLCNLGEIQLQGAEMEVLLGTQSQCEARPYGRPTCGQ